MSKGGGKVAVKWSLNYERDHFHVFHGELLMCAHHTAIYRIEDGAYIDGPFQDARLTRIALARAAGTLYVAADGIAADG